MFRRWEKFCRFPRDFFCSLLYSGCTSCVLVSLSWSFCLFAPLCLYLQHTTQTSMPQAGRFLVLCTLSVLLCPDCPGFTFSPLLYNTHDTHIHASGGIRTCNPSKRSAADPCPRPRGHWDRLRKQDRPTRSASLHPLHCSGSVLVLVV